MKQTLIILAVTFASCMALAAQGANTVGAEMKAAYNSVKNNLLQSAEKVSEADYGFKPTPEIRSFAEVLDHAAAAQSHSCGAVIGGQHTGGGEPSTKADVISALKASFEQCDRAFDSLTDANAFETIKTPRGERTRVSLLAGVLAHDNEQYGILSVYMRLKGIVPPSSESAAKRK